MFKNNYIRLICSVLIILSATSVKSQTFPFTSGTVPLCDTVTFSAFVTGVNILQPPGSGLGSTLTSVTINITSNHPQTLKITLTSPAGTDLLLAEFLGAGGTDYILTNFTYSGSPSITTGTPPFTGNFLAQGGSFSIFDGEDPNGSWIITVVDTACWNIPPGGTGGGPWVPSYFNGSASADGGIAIGNGSALPVNLTELTARQKKDVIVVDWATASEVNNAYFNVERSINSEQFENLGSVSGNGTTSSLNRYNFTDENPVSGIQYYRLKQTDYDGKIWYHGPVAAEFSCGSGFGISSVYSMDEGLIKVTYSNDSNDPLSVKMYDLAGKLVCENRNIQSMPGVNAIELSVKIDRGMYILTIERDNQSDSVRFIY